jgi:D-lyxose ketol-isomerase
MRLKRSIVNQSIEQAMAAFSKFGIHLPPFAFWTLEDWRQNRSDCDEIRDCMLGWDVTDFGTGDFEKIGRILFTLRNGSRSLPSYPKPYAEKLLFDPEGQRAPAHFHRSKMEDITNRAGGNIIIQLTSVNTANHPSGTPLKIQVDGQTIELEDKGMIRLHPGESVCIPPRTIHQFWGEPGSGITISSEVSSVCDDLEDNYFLEPMSRFPELDEDEPPRYCLCHEYNVLAPK